MISRLLAPIALVVSLSLVLPVHVAFASAQPAGPDPSTMTDQQKVEHAKKLYGEAESAYGARDFATALAKYEQAYLQFAPSLHVFNFNIGLAAFETKDCIKAKQAFQRFLDLVPDHPKRADAQEKLMDIERTGCAAQQPATGAVPTPAPTATPRPIESEEEDSPDLSSRRSQREEASEREREEVAATTRGAKGTAGIALTAIGAAALVGGGVTLALAAKTVNDLNAQMEPGPTMYPPGDYSDETLYRKDTVTVPALNITTGVLLGAGAIALATGIALMVIDKKNRKKGGGKKKKKAREEDEEPASEDEDEDTGSKKKKRSRDEDEDDGAPDEEDLARRHGGRRVRLLGVGPTLLPSGGGAAAILSF